MSVDLHHGRCEDVLATMPECSVDAIVTDPPYDLVEPRSGGDGRGRPSGVAWTPRTEEAKALRKGGFMGKAWDATGVAFRPETWQAVMRVMKPGGYLLSFGGTRTEHRMTCAIEDAGFTIKDKIAWLHGQGFPKHKWHLKPALELIVLAQKPFKGSAEANVLAHGTGALNIAATRIVANHGDDTARVRRGGFSDSPVYGNGIADLTETGSGDAGRWPANLLLDETAAAMLDEQAGERPSTGAPGRPPKPCKVIPKPGMFKSFGDVQGPLYSDAGGPSRFFYVSKPSPTERSAGLTGRNTHVTVKPIKLMEYLCTLICPPGGIILDPFMGSGTTGCACVRLGFDFIGIDADESYVETARQRIAHWTPTQQRLPIEVAS